MLGSDRKGRGQVDYWSRLLPAADRHANNSSVACLAAEAGACELPQRLKPTQAGYFLCTPEGVRHPKRKPCQMCARSVVPTGLDMSSTVPSAEALGYPVSRLRRSLTLHRRRRTPTADCQLRN